MTAWHNRQRTAGALLSLSLVGGAALSAGALAPTPTPLAPPRAVTLSVGWVTAPAPGPTTESAVTNQNGASAASRPASEPTPEPAPEPTATPASEPMPNAAPEPVAKTQVAAPLTPNTFPKPANRRERPPRKEQPARPVEQPVVARQTSSIATSALVPPHSLQESATGRRGDGCRANPLSYAGSPPCCRNPRERSCGSSSTSGSALSCSTRANAPRASKR